MNRFLKVISFLSAILWLACAGCSIVSVRLPDEFKSKKLEGDPPPGYSPNKLEPGTATNPDANGNNGQNATSPYGQ